MAGNSSRWIWKVGAPVLVVAQAQADDSIGYSHESYVEDHGRMTVQTETAIRN